MKLSEVAFGWLTKGSFDISVLDYLVFFAEFLVAAWLLSKVIRIIDKIFRAIFSRKEK